jgi:hypothetical protein
MVIWKLSWSLRLTGTVILSMPARKFQIDIPFKMSPTSSIVRSLPDSAGLLTVPIPPSHPQNRIEKTTFWMSRVHKPLYLFLSASSLFRPRGVLVIWRFRSYSRKLRNALDLILDRNLSCFDDWLHCELSERVWRWRGMLTMCCWSGMGSGENGLRISSLSL